MQDHALRVCLIIVLAFCFFILENIWGVAQNRIKPQSNTQQSQQQPETDKRGTLDAPFIVKAFPADRSQQEAEEDARDKSEKRWNDRATIFIGLVTGLILLLQLFVFGWQAISLRKTIVTMKELGEKQSADMQASIATAQAAADAARDQVLISQEALITTERAFIYCEEIRAVWTANKETELVTKWTFYPIWKNNGKTPTKRATNKTSWWVGVNAGDIPPDFDFTNADSYSGTMIGPDARMFGSSPDITVETLQKIRDGAAHAYLWGWFDYDDIFTNTQRHRTEFCLEIQVTGNPIYQQGGFVYRQHGPFNGFDEDCYCKPKPYQRDGT